ncbi:MAG TPA: ABC transporter permease [Vicinamibacterales bacterium]|nr:ABC transporter permease [Vicinamibacterales bacterium]
MFAKAISSVAALLNTTWQDVRYGVRTLRRAPAFTAIALLTLGLGIGANTAIFSIVNGVILRPLGYPKPEQLMYLTTQFPGLGFSLFWVSPPEYMEFREINRSFSSVGAYTTGEVNLTAGDRPLRARSAAVDEHLLRALGLQAAQGRLFAAGEANVSGPPPTPGQPGPPTPPPAIAILSHELWQAAFGGRPIVGQSVDVNGRRLEVLGIMPPGADVMDNRTEIWLPLGLNPANRQNRGNHYLYLIGRLKDGVTAQAANTELDALMKNWGERVGVTFHTFSKPNHFLQMKTVQDEILGGASRAIWVLQAAVGLVLLIACANLANLLLARAERRHREFAVRTAIGASRGRLLRQFMTEGVLLSVAGGALGLVLARVGVRALVRAYPTSLPRTSEVIVDPLVLLFTFGIATATGVLFGLAPIMHTRVKGLVTALKEGGARGATGGTRHHVRHGLVMLEVALAVMLVIGAGLLVRTVYNLTNVDAGFDRSRLVTFSITLPPASYPRPSARGQLFQRLLDNLRGVAGVQAATAMSGLPPNRPLNANDTDIDNYTAPKEGPAEVVDYYQNVMSDYFETMGIPIVQGRSFQPADAASPGMVAVVNETLANTFWKGQDPIGRRLRQGWNPQIPWYTVIGVAKDVKQGGVDRETGTEFYFFVDQIAAATPPFNNAPVTMNVVLRTTLPPAALSRTIEGVVSSADRTVPIVRLQEMEDVFAESIRRPRLLAQLVGAFAGLALLLAAIGTYGVLSYMVAERRREIGIRLALGAERSSVLAQIMKQGLVLTAIGVLAGLAGAFGLNRLIASLLFGVQPMDATTLVGVIASITLVAAFACWLPAWRASRLDPSLVLRDD